MKGVRYFCFSGMITFILLGIVNESYNIVLIGIIFLWLNNVFFAIEKLNDRIFFGVFQMTFFIFLLAKPFILLTRGEKWYIIAESKEGVDFALFAIACSLLFMFFGALLCEEYGKKTCLKSQTIKSILDSQETLVIIQNVSLILFGISIIFYGIVGYEKVVFIRERNYLAYYTSFQSNLSPMIHRIASMMKYSLCIFLATFPSKKKAFIPLALFFVSAIPDLIVGIRNTIMLNSIFILLYYHIRDNVNKKEIWLGKVEKLIIILSIPFVIVFLAAYSNLRIGRTVEFNCISSLLVDFFYGQGVSFDVLSLGYRTIPYLPNRPFRNYTFGGIIDYFIHGTIGQKIFGTVALPAGNNMINALESNSFAHNMSYISLQEEYLAGRGWGSSYLLEVYVDYGYLGVIVFSFILGSLLIYAVKLFRKNLFCRVVVLLVLTSLFFMPRSEATGCLQFLFTIQFWSCYIFCYVLAGVFKKSYFRRKEKKDV